MRTSLFALALALFPLPGLAHEVWLDPVAYQVAAGASVAADLRNGQYFEGPSQPFNTYNFVRFERISDGEAVGVTGRLGNRPAFTAEGLAPGLHVIVYESKPSWLRYREWEKFLKFAAHKDFPDIEARHDARDLPRTGFLESYTRFVKSLVAVGAGEGADAPVGMETEIVALANPYTFAGETLPVRVLYQGAPRGDAQVELFERAPDGTVEITLHCTDAAGEAALPVKPGHEYLVDAVVLREPVPGPDVNENAVWESLWAALTFAVPER